MNVLFVASEVDDRLLGRLRQGLPALAFHPVCTQAEFREALAAGSREVAVTEYDLPWGNGAEVVQAVRQRWPACPVIVFTATDEVGAAVAAMKAGAIDFIVRNEAGEATLRRLLRTVMKRPPARTQATLLKAVAYAGRHLRRTEDLDGRVPDVLACLGRALGASRVRVYENYPGREGMLRTSQHYWWADVRLRLVAPAQRWLDFSFAGAGLDRWADRLQAMLPLHGPAGAFPEPECPFLEEQEVLALALVPIMSGGNWWGFLCVEDCQQERTWSAMALYAAQSVAGILGGALDHRQMQRAAAGQLARQQALLQSGMAVSSSLDLETILERMAEQMGDVIDVTSVRIASLDANSGKMKVLAEYFGAEATVPERVSRRGQVFTAPEEDVMLAATPPGRVQVDHVDDPHLSDAEKAHMRNYDGKSILRVPLDVKGKRIGMAELWESRYRRDFTQEEIALCQGIARQAAIALENAQLYAETKQRADELAILHRVAQATATLVDVDELLEQTTEMIAASLYPEMFGFVLVDEESGNFYPHYSYHGVSAEAMEATIPPHRSVVGHVVRTGEPLVLADVAAQDIYYEVVPSTRSEIAVPVNVGREVLAVINAESPRPGVFSDNDVHFLTTLAGQVAAAMERLRLYSTLREHAANLAGEVAQRTAELQTQRDRMLAILESAGEGVVFTDKEGTILYVNPALERQIGYSRAECLGKTPRLWRSDQMPKSLFKEMWGTILGGSRWRGELVNRRKDGTHFDAALTITPIYSTDETLTGFVGIQADISHLKEVDRLKSKFITNVSHELRTPLTNMRTYVSLLERGKTENWTRYVNVIKHETERLTRLIQDLLDLSRLDSSGNEATLGSVNVVEIVNRVVSTLAPQAEEKGIDLEVTMTPALPAGWSHGSQLQQVLHNLLGNALAYTPAGGMVTVDGGTDVAGDKRMIWLTVADSGPGIPPEDMPRLFDRFFRGQVGQASGEPGTGLGLSICKEIVEQHGGRIEVESEEGEGTAFTVWLLVAERA